MTSAVWLVMMSKKTFMPFLWAASMSAFMSALVPRCGSIWVKSGDPVAVVTRRFLAGLALDRLVLEARRQPDGRRAHALDVVEFLRDAGKVTTVVERLVAGVEAGREFAAGQPPLSLVVLPLAKRSAMTKEALLGQ